MSNGTKEVSESDKPFYLTILLSIIVVVMYVASLFFEVNQTYEAGLGTLATLMVMSWSFYFKANSK